MFRENPNPSGNSSSRAALYLRVSTNPQEEIGTSLETQKAACDKYCHEHGLIPQIVLKETWSGLILDRSQLDQLRELARRRQIDAIVVFSTDRLSRDPVHLLVLLEEWDGLGIKTHFVTEPRDDSLEGQLITFVRGWTGKVEAFKIVERTGRGRRERAKSGRLPTGAQRYGWTYIRETGKREINENEAQVIRDMTAWVVRDGVSWGGIRDQLHEKGIPAPEGGDWWGLSTIRRILKDSALIGESYGYRFKSVEPQNGSRPGIRYKKTRREERPKEEWISLPGATPAILSVGEFDALQRQLQRNSVLTPRAQKHQYLLAGFVWCGNCGARYYGEPCRGKRYYRCAGRRSVSSERCRNPMMDADRLEQLVTWSLYAMFTQPDTLRLALLRLYKPENRAPLEAKVMEIQRRLDKLSDQERRLLHCYVRGDFDVGLLDKQKKGINSDRQRLTEERDSLSRSLEDLATFELDEVALEQLRQLTAERWISMGFEEQRRLFDWLELKFEIMPDKSIKYSGRFPIPELVETHLRDEFPQYECVGVNNQHP